MRSVRFPVGLVLVGALVSACKSTTTPPTPVPTRLVVNPTTLSFDALDASQAVGATVFDQDSVAMSGQTISWSVDDPDVATVGASGASVPVTAAGNGSTIVRATSGSLTAQIAVDVLQVTTQLFIIKGNGQTGSIGTKLADSLIVELRDSRGNPVPGGAGGQIANSVVTFAVTSGGGAIAPASANVGTNGQASGAWTLGTTLGAQAAMARTAGGAVSTAFTATAVVGAPDSLAKVSGDNQTGTTGNPLPDSIVVLVTDSLGNPYNGGVKVGFKVTSGGGSVSKDTVLTDANGHAAVRWTMGSTVGTQTMNAGAVGISKGSPATFTANAETSVVTALTKYDGDNLIGLVGKPTNVPPTVKVVDQADIGVSGVTVNFAVTGGGGSVGSASTVTDADGLASVPWTLGGTAGANSVDASSAGLTTVTFNATGQTAAYNIVVRFFGDTTKFTAGGKAAFTAAATKWETLIFGDLQPALVNAPAGSCQVSDFPAISNETIDDVVIYAKADTIDGPGNILGQAGPCYVRSTASTNPSLTAVGVMFFDKDDLAALENSGDLDKVIVHEMGHVLGFGVLWNYTPFALLTGAGGSDPYFNGARARGAFDRVGGTAYVAGPKVPVENTGGSGTRDAHWRESVFGAELMTGFYDSGKPNPLSIVTLGSLWDMGYLVDYADADSYVLPAPPPGQAALRTTPTLELVNDIWRGPITVIDPDGRVVRVIRQ